MKRILLLLSLLLLLIAIVFNYAGNFDKRKYSISCGIDFSEVTPNLKDGEKIATMLCLQCHYDANTKSLAGDWYPGSDRVGKFYAPNITSDSLHGMKSWNETQFAILLRTGVKRDSSILTFMPRFSNLSDQDIISLLTYLKSHRNTAVEKPNQSSKPSMIGKLYLGLCVKPITEHVASIQHPDINIPLEYGYYVANARYQCYFCHSRHTITNNQLIPERSKGYYKGNNPQVDHDNVIVCSTDITFGDKSPIKEWSLQDFKIAMRLGTKPDGSTFTDPMYPYPLLDSLEITSVYTFLKSLGSNN